MERLAASAAHKLIALVFFVCWVFFFSFGVLFLVSICQKTTFYPRLDFSVPALMTKLKAAASEIVHLEYPPGAALSGENLHIFPFRISVLSNSVVVALLGSCAGNPKKNTPHFLATVSKAAQPSCDSACLTLVFTDFSVNIGFYYQLLKMNKSRQRSNLSPHRFYWLSSCEF